jgi:uncharacterized protein YcnI
MRTMRTVSILAAAATALVMLTAGPASAHVTIPGTAVKGAEDAIVTLSVPNEFDTASTTKFEVQIPKDVNIATVSPQAKPGWTATTTTRHLATPITSDDGSFSDVVDTVTWQGGSIGPGQFDTFSIAIGPVPDKDELAFPAIQTYSDGTVVSWIDVTPASGKEPDHPQPILHLVAATGSDHATTATTVKGDDSSSDGAGLAIAALVVAIVALGVGGAGFAAGRRRPAA